MFYYDNLDLEQFFSTFYFCSFYFILLVVLEYRQILNFDETEYFKRNVETRNQICLHETWQNLVR